VSKLEQTMQESRGQNKTPEGERKNAAERE